MRRPFCSTPAGIKKNRGDNSSFFITLSDVELCLPYGAKTIGVSLYPPLTQWATVVIPHRGVFVLPHNKIPCEQGK